MSKYSEELDLQHERQQDAVARMAAGAIESARNYVDELDRSRETALVLTKLDEAVMWLRCVGYAPED